jgi:hypothetical protein
VALDAFRDSLGAMTDLAVVQQILAREQATHPTGDKELQRLRLGWTLTRLGQLSDSASPLVEALLQFYEASVRRTQWPYPWFGLGATKLALDEIGAREIRSPHQTAGSGWRWGAANAFLSAVTMDTSYTTAAIELGITVMQTPTWSDIPPVIVAMSRAARSGHAGAAVWLVLGRLERQIDSNVAALAAFDSYVSLPDADKSLGQLERARTLFALGRSGEGQQAYFSGAADPSVAARALYRKDVTWIADSAELAVIDSASGESLPAVLGRFWRDRETVSGRAPGSRITEHYRRWDVAQRQYGFPPALVHQWTFGEVFRTAQSEVDDRGVIYMRHGEPDDRASFIDDGVPPNESWVYHRPAGDLTLHFTQDIGASGWHLIDGLSRLEINPCLVPGLLDSRGTIDPAYQVLADRARSDSSGIAFAAKYRHDAAAARFMQACSPRAPSRGQITAAIIGLGTSTVVPQYFLTHLPDRERLASVRSIESAVHTDTDPLRFRAPLRPILQAYGVGGTRPGVGEVIIVWAVSSMDKPHTDTVPGVPGVIYSLRVRVNLTDSTGRLVVGTDSVKRQHTGTPLADNALLSGLLTLEVPPGTYRAQISVADTLGDKGAARVVGAIPVPAFSGPMEMSDLVLGLAGQSLSWDRGGTRFPLNPRNAWTNLEAMEIGFELAGVPAGEPYKVRIGLADLGADSTTPPKASVEFENVASGARELVSQSLNLRGVKPGRYLLIATITSGGKAIRRERRITVATSQ